MKLNLGALQSYLCAPASLQVMSIVREVDRCAEVAFRLMLGGG